MLDFGADIMVLNPENNLAMHIPFVRHASVCIRSGCSGPDECINNLTATSDDSELQIQTKILDCLGILFAEREDVDIDQPGQLVS